MRIGRIGLAPSDVSPANFHVRTQTYGPFSALRLATSETWYVVDRTLSYHRRACSPAANPSVRFQGPVGTGYIAGKVAELGFAALSEPCGDSLDLDRAC